MAKKITFDYEAIKVRILEYLSSQSEWASFLNYGTIDNLISSIANELAYEIQYSEYNSTENFWNMARNRSSLLQMSPMHGYIIPRKQASEGIVRISTSDTFDSSYSKNVYIPSYFQFSGGDLYVCSKEQKTLNANENYVDISCVQGEAKEVSFLAEGIQFEEKTIYDDSVDNSFFEIIVNDINYSENEDGSWNGWKCVDSLFLYDSEDKVYQIRTLPNLKGISIKFGNGIFGKKLNKNDLVKFKYISTKGSLGNIFTSNVIDTVESQAYDSNGNEVKLYCTNISTFIGGKDYPSLEEIRDISPNVYQTGNRASSKTDYITILKRNNLLSKISVWGAYETLKDRNEDPWNIIIPSEENVIHLALLIGPNYESLNDLSVEESDKIKSNIVDYLYKLCDPTDLIQFEDTYKIPMEFHIDGTITSSAYTTAEVENNIKYNLSKQYGIENMNFGENVYESDYIRLIDETEGIENHITYIVLYKENIKFTSQYFCDFELPIYPINYKTLKFYIKNISINDSDYELMAECDVNGNLIGADNTTYIMTNSTIDLNNGKGLINVSNGLDSDYHNYLIKIGYQYDGMNVEYEGRNIENPSRKNILYYKNVVVNLKY